MVKTHAVLAGLCLLLSRGVWAQGSGESRPLPPPPADPDASVRLSESQLGSIDRSERMDLSWRFGISGQRLERDLEQSDATLFYLDGKFDYSFLENLKFYSRLRAAFNSQRAQYRLGQDKFESGLRVREFELAYRPSDHLVVVGGAVARRITSRVNPSFSGVDSEEYLISTELLIDHDRAFPGFREILCWTCGTEKFDVGLILDQAIPTSRSLNSQRTEKEPLPHFSQQILYGKMSFFKGGQFGVVPMFGMYQFKDLPSVVAFESASLGNTVPNATPANSQFAHEFNGVLGGLSLSWALNSHWFVGASATEIENLEAPEGRRKGRFLSGVLGYDSLKYKFKTTVKQYFNEHDTSPAVYNSPELGHNNVQGFSVIQNVEFKEQGFEVKLSYSQADPINKTAIQQARFNYFGIKLETSYDQLL